MNAPIKLQTPYAREIDRRDRINAVRSRFYQEWHRIAAEMEAEIKAIERERF